MTTNNLVRGHRGVLRPIVDALEAVAQTAATVLLFCFGALGLLIFTTIFLLWDEVQLYLFGA